MDPLNPLKSLRGRTITLDGFNFELVEHVVLTNESTSMETALVPTWVSDNGQQLQFVPPVVMDLGPYGITVTGTGYDPIFIGRLTLVPVSDLDANLPKARSAEDYAAMLTELLPKGPAWTRRTDSVLHRLFLGFSDVLAWVHGLALTFIQETSPAHTTDFLDEWEAELGLPVNVYSPVTGTQARREEIFRKANSVGGCSPAYFEELAAVFGYNVVVSEMFQDASPFKAGLSRAGDALTQGPYMFTFKVSVYGTATTDLFMENMLSSIKPSHTLIFFEYPDSYFTQTLADDADVFEQTLADGADVFEQVL